MNDLGILPGGIFSIANGINNTGQVAGLGDIAGGTQRAFLYSGGAMNGLGTLGGSFSRASAINNAGQVVGDSDTAGGLRHAFLYSGGTMNDLGTLPGGTGSVALGISNAGKVVGYSYTVGNTNVHAFVYSISGLKDLNNLIPSGSGWNLQYAYAINNLGEIVGSGTIGGQTHAFLLQASTPEPASLALIGIAALPLLRRRRPLA
jgi:MYXO-CTERM domain-containing protein